MSSEKKNGKLRGLFRRALQRSPPALRLSLLRQIRVWTQVLGPLPGRRPWTRPEP